MPAVSSAAEAIYVFHLALPQSKQRKSLHVATSNPATTVKADLHASTKLLV
jgi:hypothetical protein